MPEAETLDSADLKNPVLEESVITMLEVWRGKFFRLNHNKGHEEIEEMIARRDENIIALSDDFTANLANMAAELGGQSKSKVKIEDVLKDPVTKEPVLGNFGEPIRYIKLPDISDVDINGYSSCTLRVRINPCIDKNLTKIWAYVFKESTEEKFVLKDIPHFSKTGEKTCEEAIRVIQRYVESAVGKVEDVHAVSIFNYGLNNSAISKFIETEDMDVLRDEEKSDVREVCRELVDIAKPSKKSKTHTLQPPFSISEVEAAGGAAHKGLYAQFLYDERSKLRIAGVVASEGFENVHAPARAFALRLTQSL